MPHLRQASAALAATLLLGVSLAAGVGAQERAVARAAAAVAAGLDGPAHEARASGTAARRGGGGVAQDGLEVADGAASARTTVAGGDARAVATASAEGITVFGGLVRAATARLRVTGEDGGRRLEGRVEDLRFDGRVVPATERPTRWRLANGLGTVEVLRGGSGLRVRLERPYRGYPAGSQAEVAVASAIARDGAPPPARPPRPTEPDATPPGTSPGDRRRTRRPTSRRRRSTPARRATPRVPRRRAPRVRPRLTRGRYVFPVHGAQARLNDDYGGPRPAIPGGEHQGNDIFAPDGTPVLAVADGTLNRVGTLPLSGNRLWLKTASGDEFFYAHLSAFAPAARNGARVRAGTVLGFVGRTGEAERTPPHLHFEIHPGGSDEPAIDPYPLLTAWRARRDAPPGAWLARLGEDTQPRPGTLVPVEDFIAEG